MEHCNVCRVCCRKNRCSISMLDFGKVKTSCILAGAPISGGCPLLQGPVMSSIDPQLKLHLIHWNQDSNKNQGNGTWTNLKMFIFSYFPYTPVIKHSNGKSPFSIGNTSSKGSFSIAMFDYQRVFPRQTYVFFFKNRLSTSDMEGNSVESTPPWLQTSRAMPGAFREWISGSRETGVPRSGTCTLTVFIVFNLGILGDYNP